MSSDECKPGEYVCPFCKTQGGLEGKNEDYQSALDKFSHRIWRYSYRVYEDDPETNLQCRVCKHQVHGRLGPRSY